ncbi:hypothetical protein [Pseudonocardia sp. NPDC046786]|uniref:hypothetical protein n=1 Tax=Pseudonocardia sp. NPDC046786 TaxID=3155471 RepID=UPI00340C76D0
MLTAAINEVIGRLFASENRDQTVAALMDSQADGQRSGAGEASQQRLADAEAALRRYQSAIAAGVDPDAMVEAINQAQADRDHARAELAHVPKSHTVGVAEVHAMIDSLGDVGSAIGRAHPERLARLYRDLGLEVRYRHTDNGGQAAVTMVVANECVRGGT